MGAFAHDAHDRNAIKAMRECMHDKAPESLHLPDIGPQLLTVAWRKAADTAGYPNHRLRDKGYRKHPPQQ